MKQLIEQMERRIENQKEEMKRTKAKILKSLEEDMTAENLSRASIIIAREEKELCELRAKLEVMFALEKNN